MDDRRERSRRACLALALVAMVAASYSRAGTNGFVDYDDDVYVYRNPQVSAGLTAAAARWAFTEYHAGNWGPLSWLSHMVDVELYGLDPAGHHWTSVALHAAAVLVLFFAMLAATGLAWRSFFTAALFGVHPLRVESVAWVAERKDVLAGLFFLITVAAYIWYARRPGRLRYTAVAVAYACALLSKPSVVTLPFALVLLDWWPLRRLEPSWPGLRRALVEKAPLLGCAGVLSGVAYAAQRAGGTLGSVEVFSFRARLANAVVSYVRYIGDALWPTALGPLYPHPSLIGASIPTFAVAGAVLAAVAITWLAVRLRGSRPYLLVGWLWYLGTLVPMSGVVQFGLHARADRFTYIPAIGLAWMAAWGTSDLLLDRARARTIVAALACAVLAALSVATWIQVGHWRDSESVARRAIAVAPVNPVAWQNLGAAQLNRGEYAAAEDSLSRAIRANPTFPEAWFNLGIALGEMGRHPEALRAFREALRLAPDDPTYQQAVHLATAMTGEAAERSPTGAP